MVGCVLFLVSGHIGIIEVCHGRFRLLPRDRWAGGSSSVNQLGLMALLRSPGWPPSCGRPTGEVISVAVINWGTALGAACFSVAGLAQLFERPDSVPAPAATPAVSAAPRPRAGD